jgi:type VI secretion system secreted protein VgrG
MMDEQAGSRRAADYAPVEVNFSPDPGFQLLFDGMHAEEELGRPFLINLDLSSGTLRSNVSTLIGSACSVWLYQAEDEKDPDHYFHGVVTRIRAAGLSGGAYRYKLELRPWIWLLSQIADCRIFQKKTAFQIVTQIFRDAGFSDFEDHRQSGAGDIELEYCVQYRETSLAFVTRLMEQFGFYYYFKFSRSAHTLVLADDPNAHTLVDPEIPYQFDQTEYRAVSPHVWEWSADLGLLSGQCTLRDYNFTTPSADLTAKTRHEGQHQHGDFDVYDYPGPYDNESHGHRLSDVRMQSISRQRVVYAGQSNSRKIRAGWRFKLSNYPDRPVNGEYLICRSVTTVSTAEGTPNPKAETVDTYRVELSSIKGDVPFRLLNLTPRPMIRGPQTAKVVGESGEEITTDEYGRIKVQFHWDRSDTPDDERSCWIRVAQTWAGGSWGAMFIPRVGQEVVVEFLEGNPDRPLITGVVYNANNQVPHSLPDNKTQSTIRSSSTPGGNGFNEFRFEDKARSEEIYMHAERDWKREIGHDETAEIKNDRTAKIIQGNDSVSVLAGKSDVTAAQSITLTVGANSIKIDQTGITINGVQVQVQSSATMSLTAGASLSLTGATIALN